MGTKPQCPHIVFFGESVLMFELASQIVEKADILIIVGAIGVPILIEKRRKEL